MPTTPMTDAELNTLAEQISARDAMHSGCSDYACYCHGKVPVLVAEIRRLKRQNERMLAALTKAREGFYDIMPAIREAIERDE